MKCKVGYLQSSRIIASVFALVMLRFSGADNALLRPSRALVDGVYLVRLRWQLLQYVRVPAIDYDER